jgi:hypothetical protein
MVSCNALYSISARLAHALGEPNEPFGGLNVIFAGDFAQLPPVSAKALYSPDSTVAPMVYSKMSILDQKNTIGKIIWQQITTVVILKQNMRSQAHKHGTFPASPEPRHLQEQSHCRQPRYKHM